MAEVSVTISNNQLPGIIARFPGAVDAVLSAGTERMAAYARAHHPWQNRTGQTEASIRSEHTGPHEWQLVCGGAGLFLEYGTIHMPAFPFLRPAADAVEPTIAAGFSKLESALGG